MKGRNLAQTVRPLPRDTESFAKKLLCDSDIMQLRSTAASSNQHKGYRTGLHGTWDALFPESLDSHFHAVSCIYTIRCDIMQNSRLTDHIIYSMSVEVTPLVTPVFFQQ